MRAFRAALAFLTRLPVGRLDARDFRTAPGWFAGAGLLIGLLQALVWWGAQALWPASLAALITVAAGILITGALHEDGLADTVDGLGSGRPRDRALEIMRDSRIGSFGALGLALVVAARVLALASLPAVWAAVIAAQTLSRAAMAGAFRVAPYARAQGAGTGMEGPWPATAIATSGLASFGALGLTLWVLGPGAALGGALGAAAGAGIIWAWAHRRLGGVTGDILGAIQQMAELGFYLGVLACL